MSSSSSSSTTTFNGETTPFDSTKFDEVTEGRAYILYPKGNKVFYNPVQQFNRDISIVGIRAWSEIYYQQKLKPKLEYREKHPNKKRKRDEDVESSVQIETKAGTESEELKATEVNDEEVLKTEFESRTEESEVQVDSVTINSKEHGDDHNTTQLSGSNSNESEIIKPYIEIIEALSASGLRAIRYGKEIPHIKKVIANDFSKEAVKSIRENVNHNRIESVVVPNEGDANIVMYEHKAKHVHCVDLDPYGSATPFVDAAVQSVTDGGLLLVTCTDLAVLAGNSYPEKCFSQYGGNTLYPDASHESALRLVLNMVASTAAKYGRAIEPLLSLSIDFYVRCFIRIRNQPALVKFNASNTMIVYNCSGCGTFTCQPLGRATKRENATTGKFSYKYQYSQGPKVHPNCTHCGYVHHVAGPMWGGPLHDKTFVSKMLEIQETLDSEVYGTSQRIKGMLTVAQSEIESPFYISLSHISSIVKAPCPPLTTFASALLNAGYKVSGSHAKPGSVKTDAPPGFAWEIMRAWISKEKNGDISKINPNSPGAAILKTLETQVPISFEIHPNAIELEKQRKSKLLRYQVNPTDNWGPKSKAK